MVLQTAFAVEKAYYPLSFLEERLRVNRQSLALLTGLEALARTQDVVGKATLQDVLRALRDIIDTAKSNDPSIKKPVAAPYYDSDDDDGTR